MNSERKTEKGRTAAEELDAQIGQAPQPADLSQPPGEQRGLRGFAKRVARDALVRRTSTKR
jgi:hypothetical protein